MIRKIAIGIGIIVVLIATWFGIPSDLKDKIMGKDPVIEEHLKLKATIDKIKGNKEIDWIQKQSDGKFINKGKIMEYNYVSTEKIINKKGEDVSKRTHNARFYKIDERKWKGEFRTGTPFYKDKDKWYRIKTATTSLDAWEEQTKEVFGASGDPISVGAGDGYVLNGGSATWATVHDAETGSGSAAAGTVVHFGVEKEAGGNFGIRRAFFPVDTSAIPAGSTITSASLDLYIADIINGDDDGDDWLNIVQTSQADETTLGNADFNQCGAVADPDEGATRIDLGNLVDDTYNNFLFNATGRGWIKTSGDAQNCGNTAGWTCLGAREGHDVLDNEYAGAAGTSNYTQVRFSEYENGDAFDPYLTVEYTEPPPTIPASGLIIEIDL